MKKDDIKIPEVTTSIGPLFKYKAIDSLTISELTELVSFAEKEGCSHIHIRYMEGDILLFFSGTYIRYENN